jgi:hypothetical protein
MAIGGNMEPNNLGGAEIRTRSVAVNWPDGPSGHVGAKTPSPVTFSTEMIQQMVSFMENNIEMIDHGDFLIAVRLELATRRTKETEEIADALHRKQKEYDYLFK